MLGQMQNYSELKGMWKGEFGTLGGIYSLMKFD
jgi:hypothetical protein